MLKKLKSTPRSKKYWGNKVNSLFPHLRSNDRHWGYKFNGAEAENGLNVSLPWHIYMGSYTWQRS